MPSESLTISGPEPTPLRFDCPYKILFGPLYHAPVLGRWLDHPNIRSFNSSHNVRVTQFHPSLELDADSFYDIRQDNFSEILAALPPGWEPDLVIWYNLAMMGLPPGIEECPYPTLAIVHDWPLNFQPTLDYVGAFDHVVADKAFLKLLRRLDFERCSWWNCYGHDPGQHYLQPGLERVYDISFLGNIGYHYHRERNPWLERVAALGDRYRVLISDRYYREDYTRILNQSKIVFNHSIRGEMNMRSFEAAACGALLFCEEDNLEIRDFLSDGESCVLYNSQNLEEKLIYYLEHPVERQRIAAQGVQHIASHDAEHLFARLLERVPQVKQSFYAGQRQAFHKRPRSWRSLLQARHLSQCLTPAARERSLQILDQAGQDPEIQGGLKAHLKSVRGALSLNRFWNQTLFLQALPISQADQHELRQALSDLLQGVQAAPDHLWNHYNLACAHSLLRQPQAALPLWERLIPQLAQVQLDFQQLSWLQLLPRGHGRTLHEFTYLWDKTAAAVLSGQRHPGELNKLLLWQAFELSGYCLSWVNQPQAAIQALYQAEQLGPGSYYTYAPLLQLLLQQGRQSELLACLKRAVERLGLIESFQRDQLLALEQQLRQLPPASPEALKLEAELRSALRSYRLLLSCFEGGGSAVRETLKAWIPELLLWLPELLETQLLV